MIMGLLRAMFGVGDGKALARQASDMEAAKRRFDHANAACRSHLDSALKTIAADLRGKTNGLDHR